MEKDQLISMAYSRFSTFTKPRHSTNYAHCEGKEYDDLLVNVACAELTIEQYGTVCWGPVAFLLPDAMRTICHVLSSLRWLMLGIRRMTLLLINSFIKLALSPLKGRSRYLRKRIEKSYTKPIAS
jgi:hypothetical protein